jgi:flagellar secretion chaperone FliS
MSSANRSNYLESKVLTATPHQLHLMLLEGAIRFGRMAESRLRQGDEVAAAEPLTRAIDIVGELLAGVRGGKLPMNQQLAELYLFLFRRVLEAKIHTDADKLAEALRLLDYERQTWQLICEKAGVESPPASSSKTAGTMPHLPHSAKPISGLSSIAASSGFSLEA